MAYARVGTTGDRAYLGILNNHRYAKDGVRIFSALGGAVEMTPAGREQFKARFDVNLTDGDDARFQFHLRDFDDVTFFFKGRNAEWFEMDPDRELREELCGLEFPGQVEPIVPPDELAECSSVYLKTVVQDRALRVTSARGGGLPSARLFHYFEWGITPQVERRLRASAYIRFISEQELALPRDDEGMIMLPSGELIGSNIMLI